MLEIELKDICSCATEGMRELWLPLQSPGLAGSAGGLGSGDGPVALRTLLLGQWECRQGRLLARQRLQVCPENIQLWPAL